MQRFSKPMIAWLIYTAFVALFFFVRNVLRLRLVFMYDKFGITFALVLLMVVVLIAGWGAVIFRRHKPLGVIAWVVSAFPLLAAIVIGSFALIIPIPWQHEFFESPQGINQVVVFLGGDAGATSRGPCHSVYPMVLPGVFRHSRDGHGNIRRDLPQEVNARVQWLSEREAIVYTGGEEFHITF